MKKRATGAAKAVTVYVTWALAWPVGAGGVGCGAWQEKTPASQAGAVAAARPDDSDLPALVPAGASTLIEVDMAALRRSPWTAPLIEPSDPKMRAAQAEALGYDDITDIDRIIYAVTSAGPDAPTLVIGQGRFQSARLEDAFRTRWPATTVDRWRDIAVLSSGENAFALMTPRTFVSGAPAAVRATLDRAFGVGPSIGADPNLGPARRALLPEGIAGNPALLAAVVVDDRLRARAGDFLSLPPELRQVGLRVDVGQSADVNALGVLGDREAAAALARHLGELLGGGATRMGARLLGLGPVLANTRVSVDGARVRIRTSVAEENRADVTAALRTVINSLRGGGGAGGLRSW